MTDDEKKKRRLDVGPRFIASWELKGSIPRVLATFHQLQDIRNFAVFTANLVHLKKPSGRPKGLIGHPCHGAPWLPEAKVMTGFFNFVGYGMIFI